MDAGFFSIMQWIHLPNIGKLLVCSAFPFPFIEGTRYQKCPSLPPHRRHFVPETPFWCTEWTRGTGEGFLVYARRFLRHSVQKIGFSCTEWKFGDGKTRKTSLYDEHCTEVSLRNGTVACIIKDFEPKYDMEIFSGDYLYRQDDKEYPLGEFYDRKYGLGTLERAPNNAEEKRIIRNLPYANRGYVFKDESLRQYFSKIWWYMPDPLWTPSDSDFTDIEHRYIKNASRP